MKTLTLTWPHLLLDLGKEAYKVVQVGQDTTIKPGQFLTVEQVKDMCEMTGTWKITINSKKEK